VRIGVSDTKNVGPVQDTCRHRVILPVYVPRLTGYFKDAIEILALSLESLRLTVAGSANVTLIANQCCDEVLAILTRHYDEGWVDQLVVNRANRGRIDAVVSVARGAHEPLLTLSDSDVFFKRGWIQAIENLLATFPECGMASVVPHPGTAWHHTSATVLGGLVHGELRVGKAVSDDDIDRFGHSIGMPDWLKPEQRARQVLVTRGETTACVGCGHFLFTIRKNVLDAIPREPCWRPLGAGSDEIWYDRPPDIAGYWRLATPTAYAYHLGNVPEPWMYDAMRALREQPTGLIPGPAEVGDAILPLTSRIPWRARRILAGGLKRLPMSFIAGTMGRPTAVMQPSASR
jgi:hypothetical protein